MEDNGLLLAFYSDDFTGTSVALDFLSRARARAIIFLDVPRPETLTRFGHLDAAIGWLV